MKVDMQVHSSYSPCSVMKPSSLVRAFVGKGIAFVLTDHNTIRGWAEVKKAAANLGVAAFLGEEVKVYSGSMFLGELLAYFVKEEIPKGELMETIDAAKQQDALLSVAHPFDKLRAPYLTGFRALNAIKRELDAVEVFNSRVCIQGFNRKARDFADENNLGYTAGSDAHSVREAGNAFVEFQGGTEEEFRKAIKKRRLTVHGKASSPLVHLTTSMKKANLLKTD